MYTWLELLAMFGASMVCMVGVLLMVRIPKSEVKTQQYLIELGQEELRSCI
jgi:hypothetical protein